jgi:HNH endonuclease
VDERWRVPDRRYKRGYRWTPRGRAAWRKWTALVAIGLLVGLGSAALATVYFAVLLCYCVYRMSANYRELHPEAPRILQYEMAALSRILTELAGGSQWTPEAPPLASPLGETRTRKQLSAEVKKAVWMRDGGMCRQCGIPDAHAFARDGEHLHFDHIVPFSRNGADTINNLQLLCGPCNRVKSNNMPVW